MSAVQDISDTFTGMVQDMGTTFRLSVGIAVLAFALPALFELQSIIKGLTSQK